MSAELGWGSIQPGLSNSNELSAQNASLLQQLFLEYKFNQIYNKSTNAPDEDYSFTSLLGEGKKDQETLINDTTLLLAQNNIALNAAWFTDERDNIPGEQIKSLFCVMRSVSDNTVENTEINNIVERHRVGKQLFHATAAGDGNCLFHAFAENIIFNVLREHPAHVFLNGVRENLLPHIRIKADALNIVLPAGNDDVKAIFEALINAYPLGGNTCNIAALSSQIMMPALRAMLDAKKDEDAVKAIAAPLIEVASANGEVEPEVHGDMELVQMGLLNEGETYRTYWQEHNQAGVFGAEVERKVMDYLLGVTSHLVQTNNLSLGLDEERGALHFYLDNRPGHFNAYLGVHPEHGEISDADKELAETLSNEFTLIYNQGSTKIYDYISLRDSRPVSSDEFNAEGFFSDIDEPSPLVARQYLEPKTIITDFFKTLKKEEDIDNLLATHKSEVTEALTNRLAELGNKQQELTDEERAELKKGDKKVARLDQLEQIKLYLEAQKSPSLSH